MQNLVIVESPTKARTLAKFLGSSYQIEASMGHIRDLPKSEFGVDIEGDFEPKYIIPRDKRKKANELIKLAVGAKTIWLASDPDREGEAIAWHIAELLRTSQAKYKKPKLKAGTKHHPESVSGSQEIKRVVFHEITEEAIKDAFNHPRTIDFKLVDAQQARRILDRLVGYKLSPLLWQKVKRGISAGRVQSVALRLIVEREREILVFKPIEYWSIEVDLKQTGKDENKITVSLITVNGDKAEIKDESQAQKIVEGLHNSAYTVEAITTKEVRRYPAPPFTTSTLQQVASNKLGFTAKKTMSLAQSLYEHGLITYMRTDSVNLAPSAVATARSFIEKSMGASYLPKAPRVYKSKSKNAQEAHEAIRPTTASLKSDQMKERGDLNRDHVRLYDLIWKRFIACQTADAVLDQKTIDIEAIASSKKDSYILRATGSTIKFDGWLRLYRVSNSNYQEEEEQDKADEDKLLPELTEGEQLEKVEVRPEQHFTEPPPRYNEASLIKKLEELGIGRPSTYAPILSTLTDRFYIEKRERKLFPTPLGSAATDFLMKYFSNIIDYTFTAQLEDELDEIARGERQWKPTLKEFYGPFAKKLAETETNAEKVTVEVETTNRICPECGKPLLVRIGKFGKFLACSGFPECKHTESVEERVNAKCPEDGGEIVIRKTRRGKTFYGCKNWPTCKFASWNKPKSNEKPETNTVVTT